MVTDSPFPRALERRLYAVSGALEGAELLVSAALCHAALPGPKGHPEVCRLLGKYLDSTFRLQAYIGAHLPSPDDEEATP